LLICRARNGVDAISLVPEGFFSTKMLAVPSDAMIMSPYNHICRNECPSLHYNFFYNER
jgi:hypothetical protein